MPSPDDNKEAQLSACENDLSKSAWVWSQFKAVTSPSDQLESDLTSSSNEGPNMSGDQPADENPAEAQPNIMNNAKLRRGGVIVFIALASMLSTTIGLLIFLIGGCILAWGYNPNLIEGIFEAAPGGNYVKLGLNRIEKLFS